MLGIEEFTSDPPPYNGPNALVQRRAGSHPRLLSPVLPSLAVEVRQKRNKSTQKQTETIENRKVHQFNNRFTLLLL